MLTNHNIRCFIFYGKGKNRNFAAVNTRTKRKITARLLLAVFLPMLLLSSLHIHPTQLLGIGDDCTECVNHHCGGHIGQQTLTVHDCVLCQFLTLPMAVAMVAGVVLFNNVRQQRYATVRSVLSTQTCGITVTRGPPAVC